METVTLKEFLESFRKHLILLKENNLFDPDVICENLAKGDCPFYPHTNVIKELEPDRLFWRRMRTFFHKFKDGMIQDMIKVMEEVENG